MKTFNGDPKLKEELLEFIKWHEEQDKIVQGTYGVGTEKDWKGCAVACSIKSLNMKHGKKLLTDNHSVYETELGIPIGLAELEDGIFEGMTAREAKKWPYRFMNAIPVGVDLDIISYRFQYYLLTDPKGVMQFASPEGRRAIKAVAKLINQRIRGETVKSVDWQIAKETAEAAAGSAERLASWSLSQSSTWSAVRAAVWSASGQAKWSVIWSVSWSSAWAAIWSNTSSRIWSEQAEKLLELLETTT